MERVLKILFYAVFIIIAYCVVGGIFKSCKQQSNTMLEESGELVEDATDIFDDSTDEIIEVFGEDMDGSDDDFLDEESSELAEELFDTDEIVEESSYTPPVSKPIKPSPAAPKKQTYNSGDRYMVVSGNFLVKDNAASLVRRLKKMGYNDAEYVIFDASNYYTVVASKSDSRSKAQGASNELKNRGIDCYVHTKQ